MTEEEAKTKWCPMVRNFPDGTLVSANNRVDGVATKRTLCLGSACMMWRGNKDEGYCGLGGKP